MSSRSNFPGSKAVKTALMYVAGSVSNTAHVFELFDCLPMNLGGDSCFIFLAHWSKIWYSSFFSVPGDYRFIQSPIACQDVVYFREDRQTISPSVPGLPTRPNDFWTTIDKVCDKCSCRHPRQRAP